MNCILLCLLPERAKLLCYQDTEILSYADMSGNSIAPRLLARPVRHQTPASYSLMACSDQHSKLQWIQVVPILFLRISLFKGLIKCRTPRLKKILISSSFLIRECKWNRLFKNARALIGTYRGQRHAHQEGFLFPGQSEKHSSVSPVTSRLAPTVGHQWDECNWSDTEIQTQVSALPLSTAAVALWPSAETPGDMC